MSTNCYFAKLRVFGQTISEVCWLLVKILLLLILILLPLNYFIVIVTLMINLVTC